MPKQNNSEPRKKLQKEAAAELHMEGRLASMKRAMQVSSEKGWLATSP